jgi:hypothetical protein
MPRIKRKSGGQPGNQNARKHGFYSRVLTPEQQHVLALASKVHGLDGEIAILRLKIASIVKTSPHDQALLFQAMASLRRALRIQQSLKNADRRQSSELYKRFVSWLKEDLSRMESRDPSPPVPGDSEVITLSDVEGFIPSDIERFTPTVVERFIPTCSELSRGSNVEGLVPGGPGENEPSVK